MQDFTEIIKSLVTLPIEHLIALVALGAIALAAWAILVVHSERKRP